MEKINMNEYVLAIDLGKYEGKALGRKKDDSKDEMKKVKIRTKMKELGDNEFIEIGENSYNLTINGKNIVVGESGIELEDNFTTSKSTDLHQYVAYVIISRYLKPNTTDNKISIVLACPISVLKVAGAKESYKEKIKGDGIIKIEVNGDKFEFEIVNIIVKTEDSCIVNTNELSNRNNLGIVGIGGLNMNYLQYNDGEFTIKNSYEHGAIALENYIREDLTNFKNGNLPTDYEVKMAIEQGYICKKGEKVKESENLVKNSKKRFLNQIVVILAKDKISLDSLQNLVFVGGTAIKLKEQIKDLYPNVITFPNDDDYQMLAIVGLYRVALKKYLK